MSFPRGRCGFVGKLFNPLPPPILPCHTIKNCGWEKMDCSLPSHSVVLLLDGIIGPRWQARRQEASSSSIWLSGRWSGPGLPSLGSLQMFLMLLLFVRFFSYLCGELFTQRHFESENLAGSYLRQCYIFPFVPLGFYFTQRCMDPKGTSECVIQANSLDSWVLVCWGTHVEVRKTSYFLTLHLFFF